MPKTVVRRKPKEHKTSRQGNLTVIKVESVKVRSLKPYYKNPRVGDVEKVAESLKENGQFKPIVVNVGTHTNRKREILAGNHTWLAARLLGWETILVGWVDVDEVTATKIVLADNGTSDGSTYDDQILADLLINIKEAGESLIGTTYTDDTLSKLVKVVEQDPNSQIDKIEDASDILAGIDDLANNVFFDSDLIYDIPPLLPDMIPDECPQPLDVYSGHELDGRDVREDYDETWWLAQWHAGSRGINWKQAIAAFYCVDEKTEALTKRGWLRYNQITERDKVLSMRPDGVLTWSSIRSIFRKKFSGKMHRLTKNNIDALVTPNHKFVTIDGSLIPVEGLNSHTVLRTFGEAEENSLEIYSDKFVQLVGWAVTEGHYKKSSAGICITQKEGSLFENQIRYILKCNRVSWSENKQGSNCIGFYIYAEDAKKIRKVAPNRVLSMEFILALSKEQRILLIDTMVNGDGWFSSGSETRCYTQKDWKHTEAFITLCTLAGIPTSVQRRQWKTSFGGADCYVVNLKTVKTAHVRSIDFHGGRGDGRKGEKNSPTEDYEGIVWCPSTEYGTFVCRRNGIVYVTGNTDDFHFENVYEDPAKNTKKILNLGMPMSIMPNYTAHKDMPIALWVWAAYRSYYVARYFQEAGIQVIPDIQTGGADEVLDISLVGIPQNAGVVAAQCQMARGDKKFIRQEARRLKEAEDRLNFKSIIIYGFTDADEIVERAGFKADVIRVNNRTARRREYLNSDSTINTVKVSKKKRKKPS